MKPRIRISFSGGRTSALMSKVLHDKYGATHDIVTTFANTGCEHEGTLVFVDQCDKAFGWNVVWLEAVVDPEEGVGIRSKVVTFETAARNGEPFEAYIRKYGIPNPTSPTCTSRLKEDVMDHYTHHVVGWKRGSYDTAVGIRADEIDRVPTNHKDKRFIYPLADAGITKRDVIMFWRQQAFDLEITHWRMDYAVELLGNCKWCWKKSLRKLLTIGRHSPGTFDFPIRMERECGHIKAGEEYAATGPDGRRHFFRKHMDAMDIIKMAHETEFREFQEQTEWQPSLFQQQEFDELLDTGSGCGDSCEIGADE